MNSPAPSIVSVKHTARTALDVLAGLPNRKEDMNDDNQLLLLDAAEELEAAKASPGGAWLSPAAQALYEAEGAKRFAAHHRRIS